MRRWRYKRKFSCRLPTDTFRQIQELRNKIAPEDLRCTSGLLIWAAIKYLNENSPYGLYPMLTPREEPSPEKTVRPVLRLVVKETAREA